MISLKEAAKRYSHFMKDPDKMIKKEISCRTCKHENDCYDEVMLKCGDDDMKYWVRKELQFLERTLSERALDESVLSIADFCQDPDEVIKIKPSSEPECPHCKFINETFCGNHPIDSNRNYWHMTEVFVYLHDGKDYCNWRKK